VRLDHAALLLLLLQDRSLLGADPVIWLTFGVTHFVRPEDAPVMPCDQVRRMLLQETISCS
jgi:primary-amine oxidase